MATSIRITYNVTKLESSNHYWCLEGYNQMISTPSSPNSNRCEMGEAYVGCEANKSATCVQIMVLHCWSWVYMGSISRFEGGNGWRMSTEGGEKVACHTLGGGRGDRRGGRRKEQKLEQGTMLFQKPWIKTPLTVAGVNDTAVMRNRFLELLLHFFSVTSLRNVQRLMPSLPWDMSSALPSARPSICSATDRLVFWCLYTVTVAPGYCYAILLCPSEVVWLCGLHDLL